MTTWLALLVGNSRSHWALFNGSTWQAAWHSDTVLTKPLQSQNDLSQLIPTGIQATAPSELWWASVGPWSPFGSGAHEIQRDRLPFSGIYPTLGIDRILALWGAGITYKWPVLVIDAGTALTFTGGLQQQVVGGAILPGLQVQAQSLADSTAALTNVTLPDRLPPRWATDTPTAIQSGILYTVLGGIQTYIADWWKHYPNSQIVFTGGDGAKLYRLMAELFEQETPELINSGVHWDENLVFWGIRAYRSAAIRAS